MTTPTDYRIRNSARDLPTWPSRREILSLGKELDERYDVHHSDVEIVRAALSRWGTPAIQPVPVSERLPGPDDCDAEGCCWAIGERGNWMCVHVIGRSWSNPIYTHWLPHWALPVPEDGKEK
jgi:hypothetical protein